MCHQQGNFEIPGAQQSITYFDHAANFINVLFGSCIFFIRNDGYLPKCRLNFNQSMVIEAIHINGKDHLENQQFLI